MPNQRAIAERSGLSQSTVSLALRDSPLIPIETKERIRSIAAELGYFPNPLVSSLMEHVRAGRQISDQGCLALLVAARNETDWLNHPAYIQQYQAIVRQAALRGFRTECFYLLTASRDTSGSRIDKILEARGIVGVILAAPQIHPNLAFKLRWDRYACVASGYDWAPPVDRVSTHHRRNLLHAFSVLQGRGYSRIGLCLPQRALERADGNWLAGYLQCQYWLPRSSQLPIFVGNPDSTPLKTFQNWLQRWKPDALICSNGREWEWLREMNCERSIAMACLYKQADSKLAGIVETHEEVGAMLVDMVAAHIVHNERGLPRTPKEILIEGRWCDGHTVPKRKRR